MSTPLNYRKFAASMTTAAVVITAIAPAAAAASFTDVSDRYKEAVDLLLSKNATQGVSADKFGTDMNIKRIDAAVMVSKVLDLNVDSAPASGFTDVPSDRAKYVNALKAAGIINGKSATTFDPQANMTRAEMAKVIALAYDLKGTSDLPFTDVSKTFEQYVKALYENDITQGKTATQFGSNANVTRGEFALFVYRAEVPNVVDVSSLSLEQSKPTNITTTHDVNQDFAAASDFVGGLEGTIASGLIAGGRSL
ncbi:S-layer homology domain-containing protein [Falsibacillus pallidus]|uniref:S-layer family protein n=1 Tax=Falsibacillus pallidus TaxID=493781 RepID=A0A370GDT9_9BACI|nr:S-layer homology domain-containing protein [Falsibacillus pallidus]RDI40153.1 S-layer family protein [Falsibacillus pallidus]